VVDRYGSIQAVSDVTGQAPKTISDWLRGVRIPHASTLKNFCQAVEILPSWLLHGTRDPDDGVVTSTIALPGQTASIKVVSKDRRESITTVSPTWLAWRFGVQPGDRIGVIHATPEDAIPGEIEAEEPVLFLLEDLIDGSPRREEGGVGEIVLTEHLDGRGRIYKVGEDGWVPGPVWGTALWTGKTLNQRASRPKKNG
jgi:transcriptional regulator with XRE-family HTH domain